MKTHDTRPFALGTLEGALVDISTETAGEVTIVLVEGNLDTNTAPEAQQRLDALLEEGRSKLLVDFAALEYISSAGLRVLLSTTKRLNAAGGLMHISGLNETVDEIFEISGFSTIFNVFPTRAEALEKFGG